MPNLKNDSPVAYFCAEFGIDTNLPTYAGGLGVLAGDILLEAAEQGFPMVGVGLLYEGKYFIQKIGGDGWQSQEASYFRSDNTRAVRPVEIKGEPLIISTHFADEEVFIGAYKQRISEEVMLYFLTTDLEQNTDIWREVLAVEYGGGDEGQLKQQLILGIGGVRLLEALGIRPKAFHFNEGRPIFVFWELVRKYMSQNSLTFGDAARKAKSEIVYTNHTLVPAGNLTYDLNLVRPFAEHYASSFGMDANDLLMPGIDDNNRFSITLYALNVSCKASSVSKLHHKLAKQEWPNYDWVNITNAVHLPRWQYRAFRNENITDEELWSAHLIQKQELQKITFERTGIGYDPNWLVMSWARRISDYKNMEVIFADVQKLNEIVSKAEMPILILIAGKAHWGDEAGKRAIQNAIDFMKNELYGHAIFVPNYDLYLAMHMVRGSDVWLNTPTLGNEASGTSGMKAIANGVLNCTVADGWAAEVDWEGMGWVLNPEKMAESLYETIETKIQPQYYERENGLPSQWILMMKKSIAASHKFSMDKLLAAYEEKLYK